MKRSPAPLDPACRAKHLRDKAKVQTDQELKRLLLQQAEQLEALSMAPQKPNNPDN